MSGLSSSTTAAAKSISGFAGTATTIENALERIARLLANTLEATSAFIAKTSEDGPIEIYASRGIDVRDNLNSAFLEPELFVQDQVLLVFDARQDPRFALDPWVIQKRVRFFASCPLQDEAGRMIGILCVLDEKPNRPDQDQLRQLSDLAHLASNAIQIHLSNSPENPTETPDLGADEPVSEPPAPAPQPEKEQTVRTESTTEEPRTTQAEHGGLDATQYHRVIASLPLPLIGVDASGLIQTWNASSAERLGYTQHEIEGKSLRDLLDTPAESERVQALVERVFMRRRIPTAALSIKSKDGKTQKLRCRVLPLYGEGETVRQCLFVGHVADTPKESRPTKENRHYQQATELAADLSYTMTLKDGQQVTFEWVSGRFAKPSELSQRLAQPLDWPSLVHPNDWPRIKVRYDGLKAGASNVCEYRLKFPNGTYQWVRDVSRVEAIDPASNSVKVIGAMHDITRQRRIEMQLLQAKNQAVAADRIKDSLMANISHELCTPLTSIIGFSEIVLDQIDGENQEFVTLIHGSAGRLKRTLSAIVNLAQLEGNEMSFYPERTALGAHAEQTIMAFQERAREKGLRLEVKLANKQEVHAWIDSTAHTQVLNHLLDNAIKFTHSGSITIRIGQSEDTASLKVIDTGAGIAREFLPHLFDAFHQESTGLSRTHRGSGLGLALSDRLVEEMKGTITVESQQGQGTTFEITYPLASA